jgi:hypothetical protein
MLVVCMCVCLCVGATAVFCSCYDSKKSSKATDSKRFIKHLFAAFDEMKEVLSQVQAKKRD